MAFWLLKTEPSSWSWDQMVAAGDAGTQWTGVRNHVAKNHLKAMQVGERAFFYHSNEGRAVVGIVEVTAPFYPDPTDARGMFGMVDVRAVEALPQPVELATVKTDPRLREMVLVQNSRLSVQPVRADEWAAICALGGLG